MKTLRQAWSIARRELRGGLRGFLVFVLCLALGVGAIAAIGTVRASIQAGLEREGAALLGGDAALQLTYRFATPDEQALMARNALEVSEIADFRSMLVARTQGNDERALTQVKAVDGLYPLYGTIELEPAQPLERALAPQDGVPGLVADPVLVARIGAEIGDKVSLGGQDFILTAALRRAPDEAAAGFALGPRSLVALSALEGSGLLAPGTLFDSEYRLRLSGDTDLDALLSEFEQNLPNSGIRWRDRRNGAPGITEFVERLSAFLILVGLTGLAVGGVGIAAAVRAYLDRKTATIATLKTIGAETPVIFSTYVLQIGVLSLLGIAVGLALGAIMPLLLAPIIEARLPIPAAFGLRAGPLVEAACYGLLSAALFTIWPLTRTEHIRAASLFRQSHAQVAGRPRALWIGVTAGIFLALVALAATLSGLITLTLWAAAALFGAFIILLLAAQAIRGVSRWLSRRPSLRGRAGLRSALGAIGGPQGTTTSVILSLGLGLSVLAAVGQIDWNLRTAIERDLPDTAPSYFIVDIQNDQLEPLRNSLTTRADVSNFESAPMLRGIITKINGRSAKEVAGDHWVVQGDRGITYSATPPPDTNILEGQWWPASYSGAPQISFAADEAAEMGLNLGDMLTLNVLGRDVEGEITSFREVDFSTAGIGFILAMNPSALSGAPHTHIATVYAESQAEAEILRDVSNTYPNVTAIRVRDAIERVSDLLGGIAAAITYGAMATLLTGAVVLIGTAAAGEQARVYEGAILKTLGASRGEILANFVLRSAILGGFAAIFALAAGAAAAWAVMYFVMDADYELAVVQALYVIGGGVGVTLLTGLVFAWRPLSARPAQVLRVQD
ncbi:MAG: FtsX-like permease family protein [Pseudomonadota bacterium]